MLQPPLLLRMQDSRLRNKERNIQREIHYRPRYLTVGMALTGMQRIGVKAILKRLSLQVRAPQAPQNHQAQRMMTKVATAKMMRARVRTRASTRSLKARRKEEREIATYWARQ